jgi:hypothetical protein
VEIKFLPVRNNPLTWTGYNAGMQSETAIRLTREPMTPSLGELRRHRSIRLVFQSGLVLLAAAVGVAVSQRASRQISASWVDAAGFNISRPVARSHPSPF